MKRTLLILTLAAAILSPLALAGTQGESSPAVAPLNVIVDEGRFTYFVNEDEVGSSTYTWSADGSFRNEVSLVIGGQTIKGGIRISVDENGLWTSMEMNSVQGPVEVERSGGTVAIRAGGGSKSQDLRKGALIMEDMSPALMSQAIIAYDHEKGGKQEFALFFVPAMTLDASLEYLESFERVIDGKPGSFRKYRYLMQPVYPVDVIVDERNRVCLAEYPVQHGLFVRDGYEALGAPGDKAEALSQPRFEVIVERGVGVPMSDGVRLATDIYRPKTEKKSPVILVRTPYKKEMGEWQANFFSRRGFVFAIQDVRGRFASPGEWRPFVHEADDGHDAVEWLAGQPWSDGKVGMIGGSYLGWAQWWAASRKPPHLVTLISSVAPPEPFLNFPHQYGALMMSPALWWANAVDKEVSADITGLAAQESMQVFESELLSHLPVIELDEVVLGERNESWREWIAHPTRDEYWKTLTFLDAIAGTEMPVYHQSGWFDGNGMGSKLNHLGMTERGQANQKLVLGPWGHTNAGARFGAHEVDWGAEAAVDLQTSYLRWMDRWLKGNDNGIDREPQVSLFVMGANRWIHGNSYPLEGTRMTPFYFTSEGDAAGSDGRGGFSFQPPGGESAKPDRFSYDPADPTPPNPAGRKDLLVYTTPPASRTRTIVGPLEAVIYAASSARDTDWVVRLARIDTQGNPLVLGMGILRARFRDSLDEPELLEPGKIYEYRIDMGQTAVSLAPGERLKVVVSSALFPQFSRNLNTGGNNETESRVRQRDSDRLPRRGSSLPRAAARDCRARVR